MRPVGFFTWNSQSFSERWARRLGMAGMALARPFAYAANRTFATRFLHTLLRGISRDRLDLLGEEYFHYVLKPQLRRDAVGKLIEAVRGGERIVLVGQLLENILRPLAHHFGIDSFISNRLEFRDGQATGRLMDPIVRPRGPFAWIASGATDGRVSREKLLSRLGWTGGVTRDAVTRVASKRPSPSLDSEMRLNPAPVRETMETGILLAVCADSSAGLAGRPGKIFPHRQDHTVDSPQPHHFRSAPLRENCGRVSHV